MKNIPNEKLLNKEWLYNEYINNKRAMRDIAEELDVNTNVVSKYIKRYNFTIRLAGEQKTITSLSNGLKSTKIDSKFQSKEYLIDAYQVRGLSLRDIASEVGISNKRAVIRLLAKYNIPLRNLKEARHNRTKVGKEHRRPHKNVVGREQYIIDEYNKGRSIRSIRHELNTTRDALFKVLGSANIAIRASGEANIGRKNTQETKAKMSETASDQIVAGTRSSHCHGKIVKVMTPFQGLVKMRSSWEAAYANHLTSNNIQYKYEMTSFKLSNGKTYVPDFYLIDTDEYVEIKGYLSEDQQKKYDLFKSECPNVKWKMLKKEDLELLDIALIKPEELQVESANKPTITLLIGAPSAGKSWVANQLLDKYDYISYDDNRKRTHLDLLAKPSDKPKIYDPTFKISTMIRRHSNLFNFKIVCIYETEAELRERIASRGGDWTDTILKRNEQVKKRFLKYSNGGFIGTSHEVLKYLRSNTQ